MRILIADDSTLLRTRIKEMIGGIPNLNCVGEADNGHDALRMIGELNPDMVVLDIRMPGLSGIELLKGIKQSGSPMKVCILTNYPYRQYRDRCMAEGADYFLDKNNDIQKIIELFSSLGSMPESIEKQEGEHE